MNSQRVLSVKETNLSQNSHLKHKSINQKSKEVFFMSKVRKILTMAVVFAMVLGIMAPAFALGSDVVGTEYEGAAAKLKALGIMVGDAGTGNFRPYDNIKRSEFAKIAVVALGLENAAEAAKGITRFPDVVENHWASGYINVAASQGIIIGDDVGTFRPDDSISYAEALTILVRMLGYAPAVNNGSWPTNYITKAAEIGLTDGISVNVTDKAIRGVIAQLTDNALTIPMLIQVGYGSTVKYVKSGTEGTNEETLLVNKLNVTKVEARVVGIPRTNANLEDNEIELAVGEGKTVKVLDDFNFEGVYGAKITAYLNKDDIVISYTVDDTVKYDAIEVNDGELTLVSTNKTYKFNTDFDASDLATEYNYAKVVLNSSNKVVFVEAFDWDDFIVVEEVEDSVVFGYGEEIDLKDYTIVKDGKSISVSYLKKGDILFYNESAQYAEVFNKSVKGAIKKIYEDSFEVANEEFDYYNEKLDINVKYIDEDSKIADFDADVAKQMQEEGDVEVFVDRTGAAVFVVGSLGDVVTTSF
ncbi:MAG: uncharacterized protein JG777_2795, partial [Clostridia bacterium]|nr:uncharacterized protein [Clostridia bacterium]